MLLSGGLEGWRVWVLPRTGARATCPVRANGLMGCWWGGGGKCGAWWGLGWLLNCRRGCTSQSKEWRACQTEWKEHVGAQRSKRGLSYLKELQVRASKTQGVLSADGGRQSKRGRQEADGWGGGKGAFWALLWNLHLLLEVNGDHWKTWI